MYTKNTKIVCTLGPASNTVKNITNLIQAGMNVARLNFSHGDYESHAKLIKNIHKAEKITGHRIAILQDLQGPKIRVGEMPNDGINVEKDQIITLTIRKIIGIEKDGKVTIPVKYKGIIKDVKAGDSVLINDGLIETKAEKIGTNSISCKVKFGGKVTSGNGVNLPNSSVTIATITEKDKKDLKFGLEHHVDFVALSFVKSAKDIKDLRAMINKFGKNVKIVAKIERHEAIKNLKEIIQATDAVMVARGDLGTDIPAEQVPIVQKRMIALSNSLGKPVITATQVLQSMVKNPRATRAEISDAANAVFDHSDAIMLSNETAVGKYPIKATATLTKVAYSVEKELQNHKELQEYVFNKHYMSPINASCLNACEMAMDSNAALIAVYTEDGYTANHIAKHRIYTPIMVFTPHAKTARQLTLTWGINHVIVKKLAEDNNQKINEIKKLLQKEKFAKKGNKIIVVCNASRKESIISTITL